MTAISSPLRPRGRLASALLAAALIAAAGCVPAPPYIPTSSYETGPSRLAFSVYFQPGRPELAGGELARVQDLLRSLELRAGDDIAVSIGVTGRVPLDEGRLAAASAAVAGTPARVRVFGTEPSPLGRGTSDIAVVEVVRNGRIRVVCPTPIDTWERDRLLVDPPVACANALNIANMAARPADLVAPRRLQGSEGTATVAAVDRYRTDRVKAIANLDAMNGGGN